PCETHQPPELLAALADVVHRGLDVVGLAQPVQRRVDLLAGDAPDTRGDRLAAFELVAHGLLPGALYPWRPNLPGGPLLPPDWCVSRTGGESACGHCVGGAPALQVEEEPFPVETARVSGHRTG